ncbi:hypothetical protein TanjilG_26169 [Lupinus angustifolius]|uniref:Tetraspanin-8-like n=1 Tax=Lupinus angustifolius TaxID=3871 RepID=A0A4P1R217_LUPAN|nr:PREDICTED: tetraspanin-8-like [Lupinus angustifolius]OIV99831.1 hypothetical protein TanjilG_26169 [Lupinus angustifolius]
MLNFSNSLIGILNLVTFLLSIPIIIAGIWLSKQGVTVCEHWLEKPAIAFGIFLLIVSIVGLIGACCRVSWLMWIYLFIMFLLILILFGCTIFAFVITNKGAGRVLSDKGFKEYRLGAYSNWLQNRVTGRTWKKIRSCLVASKYCSNFNKHHGQDNIAMFNKQKLSPVESGCCKPSNECGFTYISPTKWTKTRNVTLANPDCNAWNNDPNILCYNCQSCKAGFLQNIKKNWKKVSIVNIVFLIFLVVVFSIGCCAFKNNRNHNYYKGH